MEQFIPMFTQSWVFIPLLIWNTFWKGYSLWTASKNNQKKWFLVILIINTFGILEIIYIFFVAKKNANDIKRIFIRRSEQESKE